jgi:hypothetical protein
MSSWLIDAQSQTGDVGSPRQLFGAYNDLAER